MNIAQETPTKLVNTKICRCCCKPLGSDDRPILLFGEKSKREAIIEGYNEITGLEGNENDRLSQFVCGSCARNIVTFNDFKTLCRESYTKQRAYHLESGNTRVQRGERILKKPHQVPRYRLQYRIQARPDHLAKQLAKIHLACRFRSANSSTAALIQGVDILSAPRLHKNTVSYKIPPVLYTNKQKRNLQLHKCTYTVQGYCN